MPRIDLMKNYPITNRSTFINRVSKLTEEEVKRSKQFGYDYFDGDRKFGLGGYFYDPRFFTRVSRDFYNYYGLTKDASILDIGCGKGFMLFDFQRQYPDLKLAGLDISKYCYNNAISTIKPYFTLGSCEKLPYEDKSFDLIISIATIHNLDIEGVKNSLREIMRVTKKHAFIKVNGYMNVLDRKKIEGWNIVAETTLSVDEWLLLFEEVGYTGDFDFFVP